MAAPARIMRDEIRSLSAPPPPSPANPFPRAGPGHGRGLSRPRARDGCGSRPSRSRCQAPSRTGNRGRRRREALPDRDRHPGAIMAGPGRKSLVSVSLLDRSLDVPQAIEAPRLPHHAGPEVVREIPLRPGYARAACGCRIPAGRCRSLVAAGRRNQRHRLPRRPRLHGRGRPAAGLLCRCGLSPARRRAPLRSRSPCRPRPPRARVRPAAPACPGSCG